LRLFVIDPQNGQKFWEQTSLSNLPAEPRFWRNFSVYPFPTNADGLVVEMATDKPGFDDFYVDANNEILVRLPPKGTAQPTAGSGHIRFRRMPPQGAYVAERADRDQGMAWKAAMRVLRAARCLGRSTRRVKSHAPRCKHALHRRRTVGRVPIDDTAGAEGGRSRRSPAVTDDLIVAVRGDQCWEY
jgi:hypothetical protein